MLIAFEVRSPFLPACRSGGSWSLARGSPRPAAGSISSRCYAAPHAWMDERDSHGACLLNASGATRPNTQRRCYIERSHPLERGCRSASCGTEFAPESSPRPPWLSGAERVVCRVSPQRALSNCHATRQILSLLLGEIHMCVVLVRRLDVKGQTRTRGSVLRVCFLRYRAAQFGMDAWDSSLPNYEWPQLNNTAKIPT